MQPFDPFEIPLKGVSLVEAGAGTGKTYSITSVYVRALLELNLRPGNILVLTFTNAATAELKARIFERLVQVKTFLDHPGAEELNDEFYRKLDSFIVDKVEAKNIINRSIHEFEEAAIFTMHGFCQRVIEEYGASFNQFGDFEIITDQSSLVKEYSARFFRQFNEQASENEFNRFVLNNLWKAKRPPDTLHTYVAARLRNPAAKPLPEVAPLSELQSVYETLNEDFKKLHKAWNAQKKLIKKDYDAGILNRNIYRVEFPNHLQEFDNWINADSMSGDIPKKTNLFTASKYYDAVKKNETASEIPFLTEFEKFHDQIKELTQIPASFLKDMTATVRSKLHEEKKLESLYTYNDLISSVRERLTGEQSETLKPKLVRKFPVALLDEFQDTDTFQYDIFSSLYHPESTETALFMIGDPKQAIYAFRGADVYTYLEARKSVTEKQLYSLTYNYRSVPGLIESVNKLFEQSERPFLIDDIEFERAKAPGEHGNTSELVAENNKHPVLTFYEAENYKDIPVHVAQTVAKMLQKAEQKKLNIADEPVQAKDICVLVKTSSQAETVQTALNEVGVKSILKSNRNIFDTEEAVQLYFILQAVAQPSKIEGIKAALSTEFIGWDAEKIIQAEDEQQLIDLIQQFRHVNELWQEKGIQVCLEAVKNEFNIEHNLAPLKHGERAITNLNHLEELLIHAEKEHHFGMRGLLRWFLAKRKDRDKEQRDEELIRLESDENLVQISTMHGSKGLEYSIVFLPFLLDPPLRIRVRPKKYKNMLFHNPAHNDELSLYLNLFEHEQKEAWYRQTLFEEISESIRLQYVALTRAKQACIVYFLNKLHPYAPLAVLDPSNSIRKEALSEKNPSDIEIGDFIRHLSEGNNSIEVKKAEIQEQKKFTGYKAPVMSLTEPESFGRDDLPDVMRISSYSSISGSYESPDDTDGGFIYDEPIQDEILEPSPEEGFMDFPGGREAGSCLHDIMELVNFQEPAEISEIIQHKLDEYGFEQYWKASVEKRIKKVLGHYLHNEKKIRLKDLPNTTLLKEMEFHFSVGDVPAEKVYRLIRGNIKYSVHHKHIPNGYLKGFIDLVFKHQNRYYILDYKSNYLGAEPGDYEQSALRESVEHSDYDLQYYLYTLALHRFLQQRISGYNYNEDFGGVFYVYMRGITDTPGSGVYFDRPPARSIAELNNLLSTGAQYENK